MTANTNNQALSTYRVLIIEDDLQLAFTVKQLLEQSGYFVECAHTIDQARSLIAINNYEVILIDLILDKESGQILLQELIAANPVQAVIMMTAHATIETAVHSIQQGALAYLPKPFKAERLLEEVEKACAKHKFKNEILDFQSSTINNNCLENMIGSSPKMQILFAQMKQVAKVDSTILISGESGTGKELVAKALHNLSPRSKNRFGAINCGAIPANLLESELFGYKKGAFTDARTDRKGLFENCNLGSLFLDEIGEMPHELQVKLLRVLQEKEIVPLGTDRATAVDVRIIAATNKNLKDEVKRNRFREDLYFRVNVIPLYIPALRERKEDIPLLVYHFLKLYSEQFGKIIKSVDEQIMNKLITYEWPGNVRELQNNIERAVVMTNDEQIHEEHLFMDLYSSQLRSAFSRKVG